MSTHWPLFELRLRTPELELRVPTPEDLEALADLAAEGVHDPAVMPFIEPWTDAEPAARARSVLQWHWRCWSEWSQRNWRLEFAVLADTDEGRRVVGSQAVCAKEFSVLREVLTGSWLGRRFQGRGIGTEMRAAVLHLAFAELGAEYAISDAFTDNAASFGVSRRLGYTPDGIARMVVRNRAVASRRLRLDRAGWQAHRTVDVTVEGLAACRHMFALLRSGSAGAFDASSPGDR
ncbi:MAG TPA: GNAT family protein [Mycobacteriales bacterium]|nr:GNAT family protein [Mycobacteriales bacterium]